MNIKKTLKYIAPPVLGDIFRFIRNRLFHKNRPDWHIIKNGILKGYKIYVPNRLEVFKTMIDGYYDSFFWEYLKADDLQGKTVLDIGGHIGINSMAFSRLVGKLGAVHVFEPNHFNLMRMQQIIDTNTPNTSNIVIHNFALSNSDGTIQFEFSSNVDNMESSGGFIDNSHKPLEDKVYKTAKFIRKVVQSKKLDTAIKENKIDEIALIKIDVEGAEHLVLEGAKNILTRYRPILLIEIHNISAMFYVMQLLINHNYHPEIIQEDSISRCFVAAR